MLFSSKKGWGSFNYKALRQLLFETAAFTAVFFVSDFFMCIFSFKNYIQFSNKLIHRMLAKLLKFNLL